MEITFANKHQVEIADLLWIAIDEQEVAEIIQQYGHDAVVVRELMLAAAMDEINDTELAAEFLRNL